jgi:signal transduction histidine kinase
MMSSPATIPSLRTRLLIGLAVVLAAALLVATAVVAPMRHLLASDTIAFGAFIAAVLAAFVVGASVVLDRVVVRPIRRVTVAAEQIADGNLDSGIPRHPTRELGDLATGFSRVTERLRADQTQLIRAEKLASIGRLAASVAHEIGNPLSAILAHLHLLHSRLGDAARGDIREGLAALERESARIERIVRGLLDYARARPADVAPIDVDNVIRSVVDLLRTQGALAGVDVVLELTDEPLLVTGQRHDLEQLFVNLFINAVDAMNREGRLLVRLERAARFTLRRTAIRRDLVGTNDAIEHPPSARAQRWLASHDAAEIAKIVVADSGPGVPAEIAERIFDPFFTTKPAGKGTGLGLAIVARIVENFHGTVWVTTAREGGAAFHILFPVAGSVLPTPIAVRRQDAPRSTTPHRGVRDRGPLRPTIKGESFSPTKTNTFE